MQRWVAHAIFFPTLAYNYLLGRVLRTRQWWNHVDPQVILGARPFPSDAKKLQALGVTGVVNMCEEYAGPREQYAQCGIEQLWLPTVDFNHPSREFVEQGAAFIEQHVKQQGTVYVHCKAGRARSATIVLWWLVKYRGLSLEAAQQQMLDARPHVNPHIAQRPVIQELYRDLQAATTQLPNESA
ncbi:dual specificity protein phosphatase family protein [Aureliella helgolandensis]|uniref:Dual specificity phosphatase, catalytic domain n=1 Tax=Aureliella helgolandensis TaxID=2527968 RepID=A0A518G6T7_9BACT|nr:dual specificity protein phosphatase family protein [Aureliella helgolandensis]QDV24300.1 hypothetical protein Q31a_26160 [Aureliella helgolandensis]